MLTLTCLTSLDPSLSPSCFSPPLVLPHVLYISSCFYYLFHLSFNFSDPTFSSDCSVSPVTLSVTSSGRCHGLVVWWDMMLGDTPLSMEPWEYPQWRDHWLQAIYLWPQPIQVKKGKCMCLLLQILVCLNGLKLLLLKIFFY